MLSDKPSLFTLERSLQSALGEPGSLTPPMNQGERSSAAEHRPHTTAVEGSIPSAPTTLAPIDIARFWGRVTIGHDFECWPWRGQMGPKGYGRFRGERAHRVAYGLIKGEIPPDLLIRHSCDNPTCCNPSHLLVGTHQDNSNDAVERGRTLRGASHPKTKINDEQVAYIRANPDGLTGVQLAAKFGIAQSTVSYIRNKIVAKSWKYSGRVA